MIKLLEDLQNDKPILYFSDSRIKTKKEITTFNGFDEFAFNLHYWNTWSGGVGIWDIDIDKLDTKLAISDLKLDYDEVIIKGTSDSISSVSSIKALVNVSNMVDPKAGTNTLRNVELVAYDEYGDKINVEMVPSKVTATVEIESPSKSVPIEVVTTGKVVFGKAIKNINTSVQKVTIYGDSKTLDSTKSIKVKVKGKLWNYTEFIWKTIKRKKSMKRFLKKKSRYLTPMIF